MQNYGVGYSARPYDDNYFYFMPPNGYGGNESDGGFPGRPYGSFGDYYHSDTQMNIDFRVTPNPTTDYYGNINNGYEDAPYGRNFPYGGGGDGGFDYGAPDWGGPPGLPPYGGPDFPPYGGGPDFPPDGPDGPPFPPHHGGHGPADCPPGGLPGHGGLGGGLPPLALILLAVGLSGSHSSPSPTPGPSPAPAPASTDKKALLQRVITNFDTLRTAGADDKDGTFGDEDVDAILRDQPHFSADTVQLAKDVRADHDIVRVADWVSNSSGPFTHDNTNAKAQYQGALNLLNDKDSAKTALAYLRDNFTMIAARGGNSTALERSDIEAEITHLNTGTDAQKAIASSLSKVYYAGSDGPAKGDLIGVLANASGNNNPANQTITKDGINTMLSIFNRTRD